MIRATSRPDGSIVLNASVSGPVVYLDNWAFIELAKKDPSRRKRFLDAIRSGADVLFSVTNAAELSGPKGQSADAVRTLLDEIGPHWYPAKLDATEAVKLELKGEDPARACLDEEFFKTYVADRMRTYSESGTIIDFSDKFFSLAAILDRLGPQWESISKSSASFDELLKNKMSAVRALSKRDPLLLDKKFPWIQFDSTRPACFAYFNLLRIMAVESNSLTKGDGMDFCHAVIGCAFANFTTLDTTWKRRLDNLPKPNWLARRYVHAELDQMITDIELAIAKPKQGTILVLSEGIRRQLTGSTGPCRIIDPLS